MLSLPILIALCITTADRVDERDAIRRGLAFVEQEGVAWMEDRKCASCHQVPAMLWTLGEARKRGLYEQPKKLTEWTEWSLQWKHWNTPKPDQTEESVAAGNADTMSSLILSSRGYRDDEKVKQQFARYVEHLLRLQQKDGSWKAGGQLPLQKRSKEESGQVTTMWVVLALDAAGVKSDAVKETRRRAVQFLADLPPGKSTEWWVARTLVERPTDAKKADERLGELLKLQHEDGGWGWLHADPSDAFGTGLALYALARSGMSNDHAAIRKARAFLLRTQEKDGSWAVSSTLERFKTRVIPTSRHWGTAWATLGLMSTMGKQ